MLDIVTAHQDKATHLVEFMILADSEALTAPAIWSGVATTAAEAEGAGTGASAADALKAAKDRPEITMARAESLNRRKMSSFENRVVVE